MVRSPNNSSILFVDDQPDLTEGLEVAFHKKPFTVYTANSGAQALEILAANTIDVVVSDEQMPQMSGSQLLTIVHNQYPDVIRIILSGQATFKATLAAINDARAHHFLLKPCSPDDIATCVARALDERDRQKTDKAKGARSELARLAEKEQFDSALESLWIAFQPIVRPGEAAVFAYEALVRSRHPVLKMPNELFEAAEEFDRVVELERRIRALIAARADELSPDIFVMVNVHPGTLLDDDLYSTTSELFRHRRRVILEITERDKLHEFQEVRQRLAQLRALGYRVAVDDLGAGYAGLNSFALITPDVVKFDMELIRDIQQSPTKRNLVRVFVALCREMNILTVAEGIETNEEHQTAAELGCDLLQGFFISPPAHEFLSPAQLERQTEETTT